MKKAKILHNPNAGAEEFSEKEVGSILEANGYGYEYASVKESGWKKIREGTDFLVLAGGDGTVRKVILKLLADMDKKDRLPIVLLPAGTANNIAKTLGIEGHPKEIISKLKDAKKIRYDIGKIKGLPGQELFIESLGTGIFPELMRRMKERPANKDTTPEEELKIAQEVLHSIIMESPARELNIIIDGHDHSGKYLMAEIMNIRSLGPNLELSPGAETGDGCFDIVLVPEQRRDDMAAHMSLKVAGIEKSFHPMIISGKMVTLGGSDLLWHVDDELLEEAGDARIEVEPDAGAVEFII
jgi:diacylglycerol kinase (ATP)